METERCAAGCSRTKSISETFERTSVQQSGSTSRRTKTDRYRIDKQSWWWSNIMEVVIQEKRKMYKQWQDSRNANDYKDAISRVKRAITNELYSRLETSNDDRFI